MSDINSTYYTQNAFIKTCRITAGGAEYDIKNNIVEISYHEDVYSFCVGGHIMVRDGIGLIEAFKLSGKETLELKFDKFDLEYDKTPAQKFIIYKIGDRKPVGNMNSEFYKLYFCTPDLIFNEQLKVSKSYKGKRIDQIITDILKDKLKTKRVYNIQPTFGYYDFIVPMLRPFESISWLSNYARVGGGETGTAGADMFFFENRYGYHFRSLSDMMKQTPYNTYYYQQNNLDPHVKDLDEENDSVIAIDIVRSFNSLKSISSGAYANKIIAVDPLTKSYEIKEYDYLKYVSDKKTANKSNILPNLINPNGNLPNKEPESMVKVVLTNSGEKETRYIKENGQNAVAQDVYMQETLSIRTAQTALANHTVLKIIVPGDVNLTAGKTIDFRYYSLQLGTEKDKRNWDPFYSGVYLITAVRHILQSSGVYQTVMEIVKNSTEEPYTAIN